jgi:hypothetical protein
MNEDAMATPVALFRKGPACRVLAAAAVLAAGQALAQVPPAAAAPDRADIDGTRIIGNRELPKILYIVPWKKPEPGELSGRPVASVLDEALAPVDREVFRRQVTYHGLLHPPAPPPAKPR